METSLLTSWSRAKYPHNRYLLHWTGPELRIAYVQISYGWGVVGIDGDNARAEGAGWELLGEGGC